jgi:hypothetical protein
MSGTSGKPAGALAMHRNLLCCIGPCAALAPAQLLADPERAVFDLSVWR